MPVDKQKLKACFSRIEKQHGAGTVFRLGSSRHLNVQVIPTGILPVDIASGVGGLPRGRIHEIFGPPSGGKTTLTLQCIAQAQMLGGAAAFIDAEHALDPSYARKLGVDVDNLIVCQPDNGEQALEVLEELIKSEQFDIVVVDSVAALVPKKELEGDMGDAQMGSQARMMSQAMRKLQGCISKTRTVACFINQTRSKLGGYGNPETTPGGDALKFYSSMRITVRAGEHIKVGTKHIGCQAKIKFVKNKVATPFREALVSQIFGEGFEPNLNMLDAAEELKILGRSGSWYTWQDENVANGQDNMVERLRLDADLAKAIMDACRAKAFGIKPPATATDEEQVDGEAVEETEEAPE